MALEQSENHSDESNRQFIETAIRSIFHRRCLTSFHMQRGVSMPSEKPELPKIAYSIREACHVSSLGRTTIYHHIAAGRLRANRIGGRVVIPAESLNALIEGQA
ncbi:helix-turn-helix domain-containing protein [uncultured Sphingosinicella sp.]|uniref:helix-turn-helix domain-containing protein n=1 Tax=uncultured Sphingosinicella sp. TaxID=478748 RepID=UPI0030D8D700|tara:strand:+ start:3823 stop:4134 length:312 start_codon:yes stop_codon:yes gene_type:complete